MRILIDATIAREGGQATYLRNMLPALAQSPGGHVFHVMLSRRYQRKFIATMPKGINVIEADVPVVVQHTRLDSRQAQNALMTTIAYPVS